MPKNSSSAFAALPSVDRLLREGEAAQLIAVYGRPAVAEAIRRSLDAARSALSNGETSGDGPAGDLIQNAAHRLAAAHRPSLRPVFNLTGTVLHTNLGRALLPEEAIEAMAVAARSPSNLEYDLTDGKRGDRDSHVETALCRLTGGEAATVVNNNAAAVLLVLNSLANRKEVPTSRGELIEIGGSFRMPEIMARSGAKLVEIGTTNRTHLRDYADAIGPKTGLIMKIHASNYSIEGYTATVPEADLAKLCHARGIPFAIDLGSGTLINLERFGLPHEPTPAEALAHGADVVTFSADKLLGGPQAGIVVGRKDIIAKLKRNPLKRALRVDKVTLAALAAVLTLYGDPDRLVQRLPTLRMLARPRDQIAALAERLLGRLAECVGDSVEVSVVACESQLGSGTLPTQRLPSVGISIGPRAARRVSGKLLQSIADAFRALPVPVIGRMHDGRLIFDLRCLDDEAGFLAQLPNLNIRVRAAP